MAALASPNSQCGFLSSEVVDLTNETKPTIILKSHIKSFLGKYVSTKTLATTQLEPSRIPVSEVNLQNHSVGLGREAS